MSSAPFNIVIGQFGSQSGTLKPSCDQDIEEVI